MQLFIAEKPSLGLAIAEGLGIKSKKHGYIICNNDNVVTWCVGHILEMCSPDTYNESYKKWSVADLPIIPDDWKMVPKKQTLSQFKIIKDLVAKASSLVNAGDPDREGCLLVDEVIVYLKSKLPVKRVLISDTNLEPVKRALANMVSNSETENLSSSALGRGRGDWIVGMNLSRLFTCISKANGGDKLVSIGRIQTPVLALVVQRDLDIKNFVSKPFYGIKGTFETGASTLVMEWISANSINENTANDFDENNRLLNKELAANLVSDCKNKTPRISKVESKKVTSKPPLLFALSDLQREANKRFKYPIQKTLDITQELYDKHKLVTYPRSDCKYLPVEQFSAAQSIVNTVISNTDFSNLEFNFNDKSPAFNDAKTGAHHAIIPTNKKTTSSLSKDLSNIYNLICERYLMQFLGNKLTEKSIIIVDFGSDKSAFKMGGEVLKVEGYSILEKSKDDSLLPIVKEGQTFDSFKLSINKKSTTPPKPYTESTLLESMTNISKLVTDKEIKKILKETDGLGTEATRANIFELLIKRTFMKRDKNNIVSTTSGMELISALPVELTTPDLTAKWEHQLDKIVNGELNVKGFLAGVKSDLLSIIEGNKNSTIKILSETNRCPKCSNVLVSIKSANGVFWGCKGYRDNTCDFTAKDKKGAPDLSVKKEKKVKKSDIKDCDKCGLEIQKKKKKDNGAEKDSYFWVHVKQDHTCDKFINDYSNCPKCKSKITRIYSRNKDFYFWKHIGENHNCSNFIKDKNGKPE